MSAKAATKTAAFARTPEGQAVHRMLSDMRVNANNNIAFVCPTSIYDLSAGEGNHDALFAVRRMLLAASDAEDFAIRLRLRRDVAAAEFIVAYTKCDTERMASLAEYESVLDQFIAALSSNQPETA